MGFTDVVKELPKLRKNFHHVLDYLLEKKPDGIILIDYPGFNLRLAKALRKKGFRGKIIHYIAPTVWAHGKERIQQMGETLDLLLTIYPFEAAYFAKTPLAVEYVGNPLQEYIGLHPYDDQWKEKVGIPPATTHLVSLFPGSRQGEIARNLPAILAAAKRFKEDCPEAIFALSCSHPELIPSLHSTLKTSGPQDVYIVPSKYRYEMMRESRTAVAKSGTVTLELALHQCPTVVVYKLTFLNWLFAKLILRLKLPYYCIANILRGSVVFPELIEHGFSADNIYTHLKEFHFDEKKRSRCLAECLEIQNMGKGKYASQQAAKKILELLA